MSRPGWLDSWLHSSCVLTHAFLVKHFNKIKINDQLIPSYYHNTLRAQAQKKTESQVPKWTGQRMQLHKWFIQWREYIELSLDIAPTAVKNTVPKTKFVMLGISKEVRRHIKNNLELNTDNHQSILNCLKQWIKPKVDEIATF